MNVSADLGLKWARDAALLGTLMIVVTLGAMYFDRGVPWGFYLAGAAALGVAWWRDWKLERLRIEHEAAVARWGRR
ncbi:hypothetical protein ACLM5J_03730 [Nocardioides sp. Bht2]|uniref:hypothetical protein n=1 Tax=Nocardioides sp. Bht2 TaxID=3392297 RepID=UPI0039B6DC91